MRSVGRRAVVVGAALAVGSGLLVGVGVTPAVATPTAAAPATDLPGGTYVPVAPARLLDTRSGLGAARGASDRVTLGIAGRAGVPTAGVAAVVLNVTVTGATGSGYLAVSPTGSTTSSNVNYAARSSVAQLVTSKVADGAVVLTASSRVQMIADVVGWFTDPAHATTGATYRPSAPRRLFDSRAAGAGGRLVGGVARRIALTSVPTGATAVAVNLTTVRPDGDVFVTAWGSGARPGTSSMNVARGDVRSNRAIVPLGSDRRSITVFVNAGRADLVVDLSGWFTAGSGAAGGSRFVPLDPARLGDTRSVNRNIYTNEYFPLLNTVAVAGRRATSSTTAVTLPPAAALIRPTAAWLTVTVIAPAWRGWLALGPTRGTDTDPQPRPGSSDINFGTGVTPNAVLATLGDGGMTSTTGAGGPITSGHATDPDLVVDVSGVFVLTPSPAAGLWQQGGDPIDHAPWWNHAVPGATGDIVEVASPHDTETVALRRDGTVLLWTVQHSTPTVLVRDGVHVTASSSGVYVVRADGTVWTDDPQSGMHGVAGSVSGFSAVVGLSGVGTVAVGEGGARAVLSDGGVAAWGGPSAPEARTLTGLRAPVLAVSMLNGRGNGGCFAYADGSLDIRTQGGPWLTAIGIGAVTLVPAHFGQGCYALDGTGRVHLLTVAADTVVDTVIPDVTALGLASGLVHVQTFTTNYTPDVRILTVDHEVWDRYGYGADASWLHVDGLDGAIAIGGQGAFVTWVPPAG